MRVGVVKCFHVGDGERIVTGKSARGNPALLRAT